MAEALAALRRRYEGRGVELSRVGDGWAFRTAADLGFLMSREVVETRKLSRAAIETLAIVAYHQPVTRAEIEEIRGVSVSGGTLDQLIELGWVRLGRRKMTPGRPMTFVVTQGFLDHFGLESDRDLPGIAELRAAGLLDNRPVAGGDGRARCRGGGGGWRGRSGGDVRLIETWPAAKVYADLFDMERVWIAYGIHKVRKIVRIDR